MSPHRPTRPGHALIAALLAALALAGCSDASEGAGTTMPADDIPTQTVTTATPGPPPGAELVGLRDLGIGQCFETVDDPDADDKAVYLANCTDPHTYEVYDVVTYEGDGAGRGTDYPGTDTVQNWSEQACFDRFEAFVGVRWTLSELDISVWWPSEESWARADRTIICTVVSGTGDTVVGSQAGTAR